MLKNRLKLTRYFVCYLSTFSENTFTTSYLFPTPTSTTHCPPPSGFKPKPNFLMSDPISVFSSGNTYSPSGRVQACPEDTGDAADGACLASTALLSHREVPPAECLEAEAISAGANAQVQLHIDPPLTFLKQGAGNNTYCSTHAHEAAERQADKPQTAIPPPTILHNPLPYFGRIVGVVPRPQRRKPKIVDAADPDVTITITDLIVAPLDSAYCFEDHPPPSGHNMIFIETMGTGHQVGAEHHGMYRDPAPRYRRPRDLSGSGAGKLENYLRTMRIPDHRVRVSPACGSEGRN